MQTDKIIIRVTTIGFDGEKEDLTAWSIPASQRGQIQREINKIKENLKEADVPLWTWDSDMYLRKIQEKFPNVVKVNYCFWESLEI